LPDLSSLLMDYQKRSLGDPTPRKVIEKGRQLGFTWMEALWSVLRRLDKKIDHYFCSADEEQAKRFIEDCIWWAERVNQVSQLTQHAPVIDTRGAQVSRLQFPNGSSIYALSSSPKALRGKRGDVTLDEFAFHEKAEEMWRAAQPVATWGDGNEPGHLHVISTHNGPATVYKRIVDGARSGDNGFSLHRVTLLDAVSDGLADRVPGTHRDHFLAGESRNKAFVKNCRRACLNEDHYLQEYMCEPLSAAALITPYRYDLCKMKIGSVAPRFDPTKKYAPLFVGVDVGRSHDLTVIWVLEETYLPPEKFPDWLDEHRTLYRTVAATVLKNEQIPAQFNVLRPILRHPSVSLCCIDMGAIGRALSDMAVSEFGWLVEPVAMSRPLKEEAATRTQQFVEQKRVGLPNDPDFRNDVCSMRRVVTEKGVMSYEGSTTESHCDRFWALALALHAAESKVSVTFAANKTPRTRARVLTGATG
jgi:phage FluMu gp28-like protein